MSEASGRPRRRLPVAEINLIVITTIVFYLYFGIAFNQGGLIPDDRSDWAGFFAAIVPTFSAACVAR